MPDGMARASGHPIFEPNNNRVTCKAGMAGIRGPGFAPGDEEIEMDRQELVSYINPRNQELILLPTEHCNFRCKYCYEDFELGQMSPELVQAIKLLILKRLPKLDRFNISWFGGEPLMGKSVVYELGEFAMRECEAAGVNYSAAMTTNGFGLDPKTFDTLVAMKVLRYQISLDGWEDEHDKTRVMISGRGTFAKIWENLLAMRDNPRQFRINLRLHFHKDNLDSIRHLIREIHAAFGHDSRFYVYLKAVGNWGGESVKTLNLEKNPEVVLEELNGMMRDLGWFDDRVLEGKHYKVCYAAQPNSLVVRADGSITKCTVAFNDPRNKIGHVNMDGSLELDNDKIRAFMGGFATNDKEMLGCPMSKLPKLHEIKVVKFERKPQPQEEAVPA